MSAKRQLVLIVEDTAAIGGLVKITMEMIGKEAVHLGNAQDALKFLETRTPDLIILDIGMPLMNGWQFLDALKQQHLASTVPVIVATAFIGQEDQAQNHPNIARFIRKPYEVKELRKIVAEVLAPRPPPRPRRTARRPPLPLPPAMPADDRYDEIMRRIAARRARQARPASPLPDDVLTRALADLNALDALADACPPEHVGYEPRVLHARSGLAALRWTRRKDYYGYKELFLFGVWALPPDAEGDGVRLCAGVKRLAYAAPFFDADAYHHLIPKGLDPYYHDDGAPPPDPALDVRYDPAERLALRARLADTLKRLAAAQR